MVEQLNCRRMLMMNSTDLLNHLSNGSVKNHRGVDFSPSFHRNSIANFEQSIDRFNDPTKNREPINDMNIDAIKPSAEKSYNLSNHHDCEHSFNKNLTFLSQNGSLKTNLAGCTASATKVETKISYENKLSSYTSKQTCKLNSAIVHSGSRCNLKTVSNGALPHSNSNNIPLVNRKISTSTINGKNFGTSSNRRLISKMDNGFNEEPPYHIELICYLSYVVLIIFGYLRDFLRKTGLEKNLAAVEQNREGYPSLYKSFESFYTRNIYRRIRDCWNRPISSVPGAYIDVVDRTSFDYNWTFEQYETTHKIVNMGSYNYLGFAENSGPIHDQILQTLDRNAIGVCSVRSELGTSNGVNELENLMTQFLGTESCIIFGMGFATNSTNIACIARKGCLIVSDELNHSSLILGCRLSGATIRIFKHNDMNDLERKIRKYIIEGQPKSHRPWKKIIILSEGIYSMEGTITNLPELIRIKKRYKCYIYLDEAHSIGALGSNGRGVVDYYNCDPNDIDILMGTFTKSFGAAGGYLAGRKEVIDHIRATSFSSSYANPMSPVICKQIFSVVRALMGLDGTDEGHKRISQLARNTRYFRRKLAQQGFIVFGNDDSPVVPLLLCFCPKIAAVIRLAHEKGLGFIGAGFPATSLTTGRVRFCISASHTQEILDRSLEVMDEIGDKIGIKYSRRPRESLQIIYDQI